MALVKMAIWTCDRCKTIVEKNMGGQAGNPQAPTGWWFLEAGGMNGKAPSRVSKILCESCVMDYQEWIDNGNSAMCNRWGCTMPQGHNMGRPDVPSNHRIAGVSITTEQAEEWNRRLMKNE